MLKLQAGIAAAMLALSGCAAIQGQTAGDSEQILAQAGFRREAASGAAQGTTRGTGAEALPVRHLTAATENGSSVYKFYDPQFCQCVYVGGAQELAKLQQLRSARVAEHAYNLRSWSPSSNSPDPNVWGAWNPEGLDLK
jgi:hypothetical protein